MQKRSVLVAAAFVAVALPLSASALFLPPVGQVAPSSCIDSNVNDSDFTKGTVTTGNQVYTDSCVDSSTKIGYYCDENSTVSKFSRDCAFGCADGACNRPPSPVQPLSITVTSPNGGESWQPGKTYGIVWAANGVNTINIELVRGNLSWRIATNRLAENKPMNYTVPTDIESLGYGLGYVVHIWDAEHPSVEDTSDTVFAIEPAAPAPIIMPQCKVTSDKASYTLGETIIFSWTSNNATYARWLPDTSGKENLPLSGDKLPANGSQKVVATVLGNPFVTLLVANEDGKGQCGATVRVIAPPNQSSSLPVCVGCDSDAHGCKPSAGYSWCAAKQKCLRSWEEPCSGTASSSPAVPPAGYEDEVLTNIEVYKNPFPDTDMNDVSGKAAAELYRRAIIGGFPDGQFKGDRPVNRAEAAKFLLLASSYQVGEASNSLFPDVMNGQWYTKFVIAAAKLNIISGYPDGMFRPANQVNTAEFLKMMSLTFGLQKGLPYSYPDVSATDWFAPYAGFAQQYHLFPSRSAPGVDYLYPERALTREEVAVAIYQYLSQR
jgi:hypothetical protein